MRVVHVASEMFPYAKTGGLADVLGALPLALAREGVDVAMCMPGYRSALRAAGATQDLERVWAPVSSRMEPAGVRTVPAASVPTILLDAPKYFDRDGLYGEHGVDYADNAERFVFFCRAVLEWLRTQRDAPDIVHGHDWQAALALAFLRAAPDVYPELARARTVLTIHNLAYQGRFWALDWHLLNLDRRLFTPNGLEFYGEINFLKAGIVFADAITTVSPRYAREIQTLALGEGLGGLLAARAPDVHGILNGVDYRAWDPATDAALPAHYDRTRLANKARCKRALQTELGLPPIERTPLCAVISRFAEQKGIDLVTDVGWEMVTTTAAQLVVLGSGEPRFEAALAALRDRHPDRVALRSGFDEPLAHRIEAGADVFLMPSRYEPCGLNQMYSLRYGTVPIVHATGGLDDTVVDFEPATGAGTGFKFAPFTRAAFLDAIQRALAVWREPVRWRRLMENGMAMDFSWERSARAYSALYTDLLVRPRP